MTTPAPAPMPAAAPVIPGKTLGIVALVLAFLAPLIGAILGFVANSQSKPAGFKNTPATVAIVLGIIFTVLYLILIIVVPLIIAATGAGICTTTINGVVSAC
ncbi:hypothetical protein BH09ACT4_BH09ACT4_10140 [soil metagenome]